MHTTVYATPGESKVQTHVGTFLLPKRLQATGVRIDFSTRRVPHSERRWGVIVDGAFESLVFRPLPPRCTAGCGRAFVNRKDAVRHSREKVCATARAPAAFACGMCAVAFARKSNMLRHQARCGLSLSTLKRAASPRTKQSTRAARTFSRCAWSPSSRVLPSSSTTSTTDT